MALALLLAPEARSTDAGGAVGRALLPRGLRSVPGPVNAGDIVQAQLVAGPPFPEAGTWSVGACGLVVRVYPGADGLDPGFARALSAELGGLVLAFEAARTRERYVLGSFVAGRTVELTVCEGGIARGARGRGLDEDEAVARFTAWAGGVDLRRVGREGETGWMAEGSPAPSSSAVEAPLARIALAPPAAKDAAEAVGWRRRERPGGVVLLDRDGALDETLAASLGRPAVGIHLPGAGRDAAWLVVGADGAVRRGRARGHEELVASVGGWALG